MRLRAAIIVAVGLFCLFPGRVLAHAYVLSTQPPMNSSYEDPRGTIAISYDEPIDVLDANAIIVEDARGARVDRRDAAIDPNDATRVVVHVPVTLPVGNYIVRWRVVSADTHVVHGSYTLAVGLSADGAAPRDAPSIYDPEGALASALRFVNLIAALLAAGGVFVYVLMFNRLKISFPQSSGLTRRIIIIASAGGLLFAIPSLVVQSAAAADALGADIAPTLLHSSWGALIIARVVAAACLLLAATFAWPRRADVCVVAATVLLATFCMSAHGISMPTLAQRTLAVGADLGHLAAASVWLGGIAFLIAALWPAGGSNLNARSDGLTSKLFSSFTPIAAASVALLGATGLYAAVVHVGTLGNLVGTPYGLLVIAKSAAFALMLALGYRHMRLGRTSSGLSGADTVPFEGAIGLVAIVLTAVLLGQMPPGSMPMAGSMPH